ncbi:hypothetical protein INR49_024957, partial [Caranx melampygus]
MKKKNEKKRTCSLHVENVEQRRPLSVNRTQFANMRESGENEVVLNTPKSLLNIAWRTLKVSQICLTEDSGPLST